MTGEGGFFFFFDERKAFHGLVESIEAMRGGFVAVQVDAVVAERLGTRAGSDPEEALGFVRIVTTQRRLRQMLGGEARLSAGDWIEFELSTQRPGPRAWTLQLEGGQYRTDPRFGTGKDRIRLSKLTRLAGYGDPLPPSDLSAAVPAVRQRARKLRKKYDLSQLRPHVRPATVSARLSSAGAPSAKTGSCLALDVGQASANLITLANGKVLYFDLGEPIWLHLHSRPDLSHLPDADWIVISHWDSDHYAFGRQQKRFHSASWIAPIQTVGPNAFNFAKSLHAAKRLTLIASGSSTRGRRCIALIRCSGKRLNGSGLAMELRTSKGVALLLGDADYDDVPGLSGRKFLALQIPHHGARPGKLANIPHPASATSRAIASYGKDNRYGHPHGPTLCEHSKLLWDVRATAHRKRANRGDKAYW